MLIFFFYFIASFEQRQQWPYKQQKIWNSVKYSKWIFYSDALIWRWWWWYFCLRLCCTNLLFLMFGCCCFGFRFRLLLIKFRPNWVNHHAVHASHWKFLCIHKFIYCWWWQFKYNKSKWSTTCETFWFFAFATSHTCIACYVKCIFSVSTSASTSTETDFWKQWNTFQIAFMECV